MAHFMLGQIVTFLTDDGARHYRVTAVDADGTTLTVQPIDAPQPLTFGIIDPESFR